MSWPLERSSSPVITVGISSCLLGEEVRYNGTHKRSAFCTEVLSGLFSFVSICPEVAIGMGTPRDPIQLVSNSVSDSTIRVKGVLDKRVDVTDALVSYAEKQARKQANVCGYVFMDRSPSCGLYGVKRHTPDGSVLDTTRGIYADTFTKIHPLLPVEEAGRLDDEALRINFIIRVLTYHDWQQFLASEISAKGLIEFHARYKYLVMAHSDQHYKSIGRLLSDLKNQNLTQVAQKYIRQLMDALSKPATPKQHTNTLMHIQGYLKKLISGEDKEKLNQVIAHYHQGRLAITAPMMLLKQHLETHKNVNQYAYNQVYLNTLPYELGLKQHTN